MERIGNFEYPSLDLDRVSVVARNARRDQVMDTDLLAAGLRHEGVESDGAVEEIVRDLKTLGLVTGEGNRLSVTQLGAAVFDTDDPVKAADALLEALRNVPLLEAIVRACVGQIPERDNAFIPLLTSLAGVSVEEAQRHAPRIAKVYRAMLERLGARKVPAPRRPKPDEQENEPHELLDARADRRRPDYIELRVGAVCQRFPLTHDGLDLLLHQLTDEGFQRQLRAKAIP